MRAIPPAKKNLKLRLSTQFGQLDSLRRYRGIYTRVAERLGVTPQHVQKVAIGERASRPVEKELTRELKRIERAAA